MVFPFRAPDSRGDEYGGFVDEEALMDAEARKTLKEQQQAAEAAARGPSPTGETSVGGTDLASASSALDEEENAALRRLAGGGGANDDAEDDGSDVPRKRVPVRERVPVHCRVHVLDFAGRPTATDLFEIVNIIKPKKLVVVRAEMRDSERFASECQSKGACGVGLAPPPGECLDIAADSSVVRVRVPDETLAAFPPPVRIADFVVQRARARMALLSGLDQADGGVTPGKEQKRRRVATGELPSILPPNDPLAKLAGDGETWWVTKGEPSLVGVKDRLKAAGVQSRFHEGGAVLLCGAREDVVVWRPPGGGRLIVSGPLCDAYYDVRKVVYGVFALV